MLRTFCYWSDGTWCELSDLDDYLKFMSDDYILINAYGFIK